MFKDTLYSPPLQWLKNRARHLQRRYGIDRRLAVFDARRDFCDFTQLRDAQLPKLLKAIREEPKQPTLVIITLPDGSQQRRLGFYVHVMDGVLRALALFPQARRISGRSA